MTAVPLPPRQAYRLGKLVGRAYARHGKTRPVRGGPLGVGILTGHREITSGRVR